MRFGLALFETEGSEDSQTLPARAYLIYLIRVVTPDARVNADGLV